MNKAAIFAGAAIAYLVLANHGFGNVQRWASDWVGEIAKPSCKPENLGRLRGKKRAPLDLNMASEDELRRLRGMNNLLAERVIENRPYTTKLELLDRMVVPLRTYRGLKDLVTIRKAA